MKTRTAAAKALTEVVKSGKSLTQVLPLYTNKLSKDSERAFLQELCFGVLRWWYKLNALSRLLIKKPLKAKDTDVHCLVLIGMYQLLYLRTAEHAAVAETVNAVRDLNKPWATKLINAVLRSLQRDRQSLLNKINLSEEAEYAHPQWLITRIKQAWPQRWQTILQANNEQAPMSLRVNVLQIGREQYLHRLGQSNIQADVIPYTQSGIVLRSAIGVDKLPNFEQGFVSVQDGAAQLAAPLLAAKAQQRVLDGCAAPGGKATHILELTRNIKELVALDADAIRMARVQENLKRLNLSARLIVANAEAVDDWWDNQSFHCILLDAPCSATGVIRRHPDIKVLRKERDITAMVRRQAQLLDSLWPLLQRGGRLIYATCSILPEENSNQIASFIDRTPDACYQEIEAEWGLACNFGRQIFPGENTMDGFYYALMVKQ